MDYEVRIAKLRELAEALMRWSCQAHMLLEIENLEYGGDTRRNQLIDDFIELRRMANEVFIPQIIGGKDDA